MNKLLNMSRVLKLGLTNNNNQKIKEVSSFDVIANKGNFGATSDEVAELLALSPFTVRPRVTELYKQGKIERKDKRQNASKRSAYVYVISKAHINDMLTNKGV